ncbi:MAG TPA: alpha/beta hydrolase [Lacunisphaera sp.]|jgi:acetyl esterase/lipase
MKLPLGLCGVLMFVGASVAANTVEPRPISLWAGSPPGETVTFPAEADTTKPGDDLVAGRRVIRMGNISDPTITIYQPDTAKNIGAAVMVCPGGGYYILAMDLEGTEVCAWLNSIGVTAVLLKYRVPVREGQHPRAAPLQDAQRALGLVRHRAIELGIDPHRIGVLGFSAGGHLAANLSNNHDARTYPLVDAADRASCRPDFCLLIYPGDLLAQDKNYALVPELSVSSAKTPPTFLAMAEDDGARVENALYYYIALKNAKVPAEMHLYPDGGHGYGLRRTAHDVTSWPDRAADWLRTSGWLKPAK